jgi:hypothetical protein
MDLVIFVLGGETILLRDVTKFKFYIDDYILYYKIVGSDITRKKENVSLIRTADENEIRKDWQEQP